MKIQIIIGSVRKGRIGPQIAHWVKEVADSHPQCTTEIIDLREWPLPMDDEAELPADGVYQQEHTRRWSQKIAEAEGYIFVFPQYNWGYPAALKNAIDHLYQEWHGKAALMVSYANRGGGKAAAQLHQVLSGIHMQISAHNCEIKLSEVDFTSTRSGEAYPESLHQYADALRLAVRELLATDASA